MKDYLRIVISQRERYLKVDFNYRDLTGIHKIVLKALNLDDMGQLNDRLDGVKFLENFSRKAISIMAFEKLFNQSLIDWENVNPADFEPELKIKGKTVRIVSFENESFPAIPKKNDTPILFVLRRDERKVWICGLATQNVLNQNQNDNLHNDPLSRNSTAFTGFDKLKMVRDVDELLTFI